MNIKEIALNVAEQIDDGSGEQYFVDQDGWIVAFAEALVAEIQRSGEPVAIADGTFNHNCELGTPLFTFPPSIEALEDKVAEACADLYEYGYSAPAKAMKQGEWKKFRKGE